MQLYQYLKSCIKKYSNFYNFIILLNSIIKQKINPQYPYKVRKEIRAIKNVLNTSGWNMNYGGNLIHNKLEEKFANYIGTKHAIAVNTGGMGIQMALRAIGIKPGDEVIHQVDTCVASAFAVINSFATPVFSDISKDTFMLSSAGIEEARSSNTKVIMPVHMWGNVETIDEIMAIANKNNYYVIEDACLGLGAEWKGKKTGSFGIMGVFSFGCLKPIQAGEGGMITTNDDSLAKELRTIRGWGEMTKEYGVRDHKQLAWNGRLSEILAAIILEQLKGYPSRLEEIRENVDFFKNYLKSVDGIQILDRQLEGYTSAYNQVVLKIDKEEFPFSKKEFLDKLMNQNISAWHANFEPINSISFFKQDIWKDYIIKRKGDFIDLNYKREYINSLEVYENLGIGLSRNHFINRKNVKDLIKKLNIVLSNPLKDK